MLRISRTHIRKSSDSFSTSTLKAPWLLLGSKTLETKCIRTSLCIMLANHDQNIESRFRLAQCVFICKTWNRVIAGFIGISLQGSINRKLDSIDQTLYRLIFCRIFQLNPSPYCRVRFYVLLQVYKEKP